MDKDPYFKDFKLASYQFIVVNRATLVPLVWGFPLTECTGHLKIGSRDHIELRDPCTIGEELTYYLNYKPKAPKNINVSGVNDLLTWLNTI